MWQQTNEVVRFIDRIHNFQGAQRIRSQQNYERCRFALISMRGVVSVQIVTNQNKRRVHALTCLHAKRTPKARQKTTSEQSEVGAEMKNYRNYYQRRRMRFECNRYLFRGFA